LKFVEKHGAGPLFYNVDKQESDANPLKAKKPRYAQARQRTVERDPGAVSAVEIIGSLP
jgi:hypothetical protein